MKDWVAQVRKGLLELCVMAALKNNEVYGYQLLQELAVTQTLAITESTLYPILVRLEKEALIKVRVGASPNGPQRRYYSLTGQGGRRLAEMKEYWLEVGREMNLLLEGRGHD